MPHTGSAARAGAAPDARVRRRGAARRAGAQGHDLGQDRQRHLARGAGADVEAGGRVHGRPLRVVEVEGGDDRLAPLAAGDEADVRHARPHGGLERPGLVAPVGGHDHRRQPLHARVVRDLEPDAGAERGQRGGDRGVADHRDGGGGDHRLEEDLQRAAGQAGVDDGQRPVGVGRRPVALGRDAEQQRLARVEQGQALRPDGRLGAGAADEAVDRAVGQDHGLVAGLGRRGAFGPHDAGVHERHPLAPQLGGPVLDLGVHSALPSGSRDGQVGPSGATLHGQPHLGRRQRHVGVADAERLEGVDDGVDHRRRASPPWPTRPRPCTRAGGGATGSPSRPAPTWGTPSRSAAGSP